MNPEIISYVALATIFGAIVLLVLSGFSVQRSGVAKALEQIDEVYAPGSAAPAQESMRDRAAPAAAQISSLGRLFTPKGAVAKLQVWLDYAGNPVGWPPARVMEMQGVGLIGGAVIFFLLSLVFGAGFLGIILWIVIGAVIGFWVPFFVVFDLGQRRQDQIRREVPDAIDLITLSVEAGLGFDAAISQVAHTMPGPLARELSRVLSEMQMGARRADALRALGARTRVVELRTIATSIVQASELGVPISTVLREQSKEMRIKRRMNAEERANKVGVKIIFPLILCLLPALFLVVLGPGIVRIIAHYSN
jgi:tight adherence protein C